MAAYTVDSDKIFLHCSSRETMEVYELEDLYTAPVKDKHWKHLVSIKNNALKIVGVGGGKAVEVTGTNLENLKKDLYASRLRVNREGLCFYKTEVNTAIPVKYYRLFDLFDWSNYGVKVPFLNTKWARPVKDELERALKKKQEEIASLKHQYEEEKLKKGQELEEKLEEIASWKRKYQEEKRKKGQELKEKQEEIERWKREYEEQAQIQEVLNPKLRISIVKYRSDKFKTASPTVSCNQVGKIKYKTKFYPIYAQMSQEIESSIPNISILHGFDYDRNDWFALTGSTSSSSKTWSDYRAIIIYYDGKRAQGKCPKVNDLVPFPTDEHLMHLFPTGFRVFEVDGTGFRWGIIYSLKHSSFLYT